MKKDQENNKSKKMVLSKETLRNLLDKDMEKIAGGRARTEGYTCNVTTFASALQICGTTCSPSGGGW